MKFNTRNAPRRDKPRSRNCATRYARPPRFRPFNVIDSDWLIGLLQGGRNHTDAQASHRHIGQKYVVTGKHITKVVQSVECLRAVGHYVAIQIERGGVCRSKWMRLAGAKDYADGMKKAADLIAWVHERIRFIKTHDDLRATLDS